MNADELKNTDQLGRFAASLFARETGADRSVMIGGLGDDEMEWTHTLSRRAALGLWYDLTRLLFPDKSDEVIAQVSTLRAMPRVSTDPLGETALVFVTGLSDGGCQLEGWSGASSWLLVLNTYEVYRFWAALDSALYPSGW